MNTTTLNRYKLNTTIIDGVINIQLIHDDIIQFELTSTQHQRLNVELSLSACESFAGDLERQFQNEYQKKLIIKHLYTFGIHGFINRDNGALPMMQKTTHNFDMIKMLKNKLVDFNHLECNSMIRGDILTMGVGVHAHKTREYVPIEQFKSDFVAWSRYCVPNDDYANNRFCIEDAKKMMKNSICENITNGEKKLIYCNGYTRFAKYYHDNPINDETFKMPIGLGQFMSAYDWIKCEHCNTYCKVQFIPNDKCSKCAQNDIKYHVQSYSYKPTPRFFRKSTSGVRGYVSPHMHKNSYFGIEIETSVKRDHQKDMSKIISKVCETTEFGGRNLFYAKNDSSLSSNGGVEFVSHPITYNAIKNIDWDNMFAQFRNQLQSFNDNDCGIHIHMSRNFMSSLTFYKFMKMMYKNKSFTEFIAQRNTRSWARIDLRHLDNFVNATINNQICDSSIYTKYVGAMFGNRYSALNFNNSATIECRIFKGNLKSNEILKNVEFLFSLKEFCQHNAIQDCKLNNYIGHVKSNFQAYPNLNRFFNKNKITLSDIMKGQK